MAVFPLLALPPEEQLGISLRVPVDLRTHATWARLRWTWLWSRRLTEPPRPAYVGYHIDWRGDRAEGFQRAIAKPFGASADAAPTPHVRGGSVSRRGLTQLHQGHTHSQAEPTLKDCAPQTPTALREGARGRGFSQRSRLPRIPPSSSLPPFFLFRRLECVGGGDDFLCER